MRDGGCAKIDGSKQGHPALAYRQPKQLCPSAWTWLQMQGVSEPCALVLCSLLPNTVIAPMSYHNLQIAKDGLVLGCESCSLLCVFTTVRVCELWDAFEMHPGLCTCREASRHCPWNLDTLKLFRRCWRSSWEVNRIYQTNIVLQPTRPSRC